MQVNRKFLKRAGSASFLAVWWVGAIVVLLLLIELSATALFWVRNQMNPTAPYPAMTMTTARSRIRTIPSPDVDAPGVHTDRDGWRVQNAGESLFTGYSGNDYNVVLFGGSTMWGYGVRDEETLPAHVRSMVAGARSLDRRTVRIFNAGLPDNALHQEAYLLADFLREGRRIDLVIFYDGVNEECVVTKDAASRGTFMGGNEVEDHDYVKFRALMDIANQEPRVLAQHFKITRLVRGLWRRLFGGDPSSPSLSEATRNAEICADVYLSDARFARQLARAWGAEAIFVLQPAGAFISRAATFPFPGDGPTPPWQIQFYRTLYARIMVGASGSALDVRDWSGLLEAAFQAGEELFLDTEHLTGRGNAIVAQKFYDMLIHDRRITN